MDSNQQDEDLQKEVQRLSTEPDETLFEELGLRAQDIFNVGGFQRSLKPSANFQEAAPDMSIGSSLAEFGRRFWRKLEPQLIDLVCDADNEDRKKILGGRNAADIAAVLVTGGIMSAVAPPAWVVVLAAILAKKIANSGLDALCEQWKGSSNPPSS